MEGTSMTKLDYLLKYLSELASLLKIAEHKDDILALGNRINKINDLIEAELTGKGAEKQTELYGDGRVYATF
jgi:hypothetical protein